MSALDTEITNTVLRKFTSAWKLTCDDYAERRLNSEHTLQSSVYYHLRKKLGDEFTIYTEVKVDLPEGFQKSKIVVDLLICKADEIICVIELKFTPRVAPNSAAIKKDIASLSKIRNRQHLSDRAQIKMGRFRNPGKNVKSLRISPCRKLILAVYCSDEKNIFNAVDFWRNHRPQEGLWSELNTLPENLGIALALTNDTGSALWSFSGAPFERLGINGSPNPALQRTAVGDR